VQSSGAANALCYDFDMDADLIRHMEAMEKRLVERIDDTEKRLREYIDERTHDSETRIVRAFGAYQESAAVRMRKIEADV